MINSKKPVGNLSAAAIVTPTKATPTSNPKVVAIKPEFAKLAGHGSRIAARAKTLIALLGPTGRDILTLGEQKLVNAWSRKTKDNADDWAAFNRLEHLMLELTMSRKPSVVARDGLAVLGVNLLAPQERRYPSRFLADANEAASQIAKPCPCGHCQIVPDQLPDNVLRLAFNSAGRTRSA
jgi:hypothetical protein